MSSKVSVTPKTDQHIDQTDDKTADLGKWIDLRNTDGCVSTAARITLEVRIAAVGHYLAMAALCSDESLEYVHRLRVSTRRVLAAIQLYEGVLPRKQARWFARRMKRVRKTVGAARDLDVMILRYQESGSGRPKRLLRRLREARKKCQQSILQLNDEFVESGLLEQQTLNLLLSIGGPVELDLKQFAHSAIHEQVSEFIQSVDHKLDDVQDLHRFRIQAKKLRYTIELLSDVLPKELRKSIYPIVCETQDVLGELNDHSIASSRLKQLAKAERRRRSAKRFRKLARKEKRNIKRAKDHFHSWWTPEFMLEIDSILRHCLNEQCLNEQCNHADPTATGSSTS
ncbi:MAG: CHAD domain-containing protein [Planctomycetales bacterium]|nr:CHAD domain-containing protein [Planctomycetales bacterium]